MQIQPIFSLVVPTLNPGVQWHDWLEAFDKQTVKPLRAIVIDSGSTGPEIDRSVDYGFQIIKIPKTSFNHGLTRQIAANEVSKSCEIIVYLTQDSIFKDKYSLENLLVPFNDTAVGAAFGRQLPRVNAGIIESHARLFNYPARSRISSKSTISQLGLKTCFISNSFAAYRVKDLLDVGGFPSNVILGEDAFVGAKLILSGRCVAYAADACVYHSHEYSPFVEFKRYFDIGVFHATQPWIKSSFGNASSEGLRYFISEIKYVLINDPFQIPNCFFRTISKFVAYRLGLIYEMLPMSLIKFCSMHKNFWI